MQNNTPRPQPSRSQSPAQFQLYSSFQPSPAPNNHQASTYTTIHHPQPHRPPHPSTWTDEQLLFQNNFPSFQAFLVHHNLDPTHQEYQAHVQVTMSHLRVQACRVWEDEEKRQMEGLYAYDHAQGQGQTQNQSRMNGRGEQAIDPQLRTTTTANNINTTANPNHNTVQTQSSGDDRLSSYNYMVQEHEPMRIAAAQSRGVFHEGLRVRDESEMFWEGYDRVMEREHGSGGGEGGFYRGNRGDGRGMRGRKH